MPTTTLLLLALVALVAGFIDAIAGGGGLLALPSLLLAGLDPVSALATNKLQGSFGTGSAAIAFWRKGHIDFKSNIPSIIATFIAACGGVLTVRYAPKELLIVVLPILLIHDRSPSSGQHALQKSRAGCQWRCAARAP